MGLRGIRVSGQDYKFDYRYLDNKPEHIVPSTTGNAGKSLVVAEDGSVKWEEVIPENDWSDMGKVLCADGFGGAEWSSAAIMDPPDDIDSEYAVLATHHSGAIDWIETDELGIIPEHDNGDFGKSLVICENGSVGWGSVLPVTTCFMYDTFGLLTITGNDVDTEHMDWLAVSRSSLEFSLSLYQTDGNGNRVLMIDDDDHAYWTEPSWLADDILPQYNEYDEGKVLQIGYRGQYVTWGRTLPEYTINDRLKSLVVNTSGDDVRWERIIPEYTSSDAGKTLTVANNGQLKWE